MQTTWIVEEILQPEAQARWTSGKTLVAGTAGARVAGLVALFADIGRIAERRSCRREGSKRWRLGGRVCRGIYRRRSSNSGRLNKMWSDQQTWPAPVQRNYTSTGDYQFIMKAMKAGK